MPHKATTYHEGQQQYTVVECVLCSNRVTAKRVKSDAVWRRMVERFVRQECKQGKGS